MSAWQQYGGGQGEQTGPNPSGADAVVQVSREPAYSASAVPFNIKIDGFERAKIQPNERLRLPITPGDHRIQITMWSKQGSETLFFHARPGEQISFTCKGSMHILRPIALTRDDGTPSNATPDTPMSAPMSMPMQAPMAAPYVQAQASAQPQGDPVVVEVRETGQYEEPLGEETRTIDNRRSPTGITRSVKASREWTRTLSVGGEQHTTFGAEVSGGVSWLRAKGNIERELQRNYSMESGTRHVYEEEITITVPERTAVRIQLRWKRIWQRGVVVLRNPDGSTNQVPYQVVVNITFDQTLSDADTEGADTVLDNPAANRPTADTQPWTAPPMPGAGG